MIWCWKVKHLVCFVSARCSYCLNRQLCLEEAARLASLSVFGRFRKPLGCIVISFVVLTWGILGFKGSQWGQAQKANAALNPVWGSLQQDTNVGVLTSRLYPKHFPFLEEIHKYVGLHLTCRYMKPLSDILFTWSHITVFICCWETKPL